MTSTVAQIHVVTFVEGGGDIVKEEEKRDAVQGEERNDVEDEEEAGNVAEE